VLAYPCSDDVLLARAKAGDTDALSQLLNRHGPQIRQGLVINLRWRSVLEADDVMQVTYFEAFQQISGFRSDAGAFPAWLRRIAQNNLRDAIAWLDRDKRPPPENRLTPAPGQDPVLWLYELIAGSGTTPSGHVASKETRHILEQEIAALPPTYRRVLQLLYFQENSVREVARKLDRTCGAVHLLRIRALDRLRERFGSGSRFF
jgi:RNA polymerase sigma-70 factor (ECF subfamily)